MSYPARVFRVLIASPSDVSDERDIAVRTIQEWNDLNSAERQLVLLPLRWETHSAPEYGKRPQEVINRQVVDHCDLLVGVFWTRIGSPTGAAESGTIEEIERVASQGKLVMLYFSQAKQDPDKIDLDQLKRLREFKKKNYPNALIESFATQIEFRDKLSKQLEIQLRTLLAEQNEDADAALRAKPITDIQFGFADPQTGSYIGSAIAVDTDNIEIVDLDQIPDYKPPPDESTLDSIGLYTMHDTNPNYFRETVSFFANSRFYRPVRFWLKNVGGAVRETFMSTCRSFQTRARSSFQLSSRLRQVLRKNGLAG